MLSECIDIQLDIVLVLDSSGSVGEERFETVKEFAKDVLDLVDIENDNIRAAVISFSTDVTGTFQLDTFVGDKDSMFDAIDNIEYEGKKTNTAGAINLATEFLTVAPGSRQGVGKNMIVLTDGVPTIDPDETLPAAAAARNKDIVIYTVAINMTTTQQKEMLESIAGRKSNVVHIDNFEKLRDIYKKVLIAQCRCK